MDNKDGLISTWMGTNISIFREANESLILRRVLRGGKHLDGNCSVSVNWTIDPLPEHNCWYDIQTLCKTISPHSFKKTGFN